MQRVIMILWPDSLTIDLSIYYDLGFSGTNFTVFTLLVVCGWDLPLVLKLVYFVLYKRFVHYISYLHLVVYDVLSVLRSLLSTRKLNSLTLKYLGMGSLKLPEIYIFLPLTLILKDPSITLYSCIILQYMAYFVYSRYSNLRRFSTFYVLDLLLISP